ncbi:MAG: hypothetical protein BMS9Abin04_014 [Planctomycetia bacterium]|nr:MAG: hypothetical protein BMS9Abin04_014 [Planctomycetia bacterium]
MTNIDQFESVFRAAAKTPYQYESVPVRRLLLVTDLDRQATASFTANVRGFLSALTDPAPAYEPVCADEFRSVAELLQRVEAYNPDIICTYRNLFAPAHEHPYSLGTYVDVLSQVAKADVLLMPHPAVEPRRPLAQQSTTNVMAITDRLAGDHRLVNIAIRFTRTPGTLRLTHVEDECTFDRYMATIEKIASLDSDDARQTILEQLLKEPRDYIQSCRDEIAKLGFPITVEESVTMGHLLATYQRLVAQHEVNLLVMNTKDENQLAMHGVAYPLTVELRGTPLLLL